jgi:hypothetical protein
MLPCGNGIMCKPNVDGHLKSTVVMNCSLARLVLLKLSPHSALPTLALDTKYPQGTRARDPGQLPAAPQKRWPLVGRLASSRLALGDNGCALFKRVVQIKWAIHHLMYCGNRTRTRGSAHTQERQASHGVATKMRHGASLSNVDGIVAQA